MQIDLLIDSQLAKVAGPPRFIAREVSDHIEHAFTQVPYDVVEALIAKKNLKVIIQFISEDE